MRIVQPHRRLSGAKKPVEVAIVAKPMSKMSELPIGVFYDEPRQIIISGHQKGLGWGMVFGLVGVCWWLTPPTGLLRKRVSAIPRTAPCSTWVRSRTSRRTGD